MSPVLFCGDKKGFSDVSHLVAVCMWHMQAMRQVTHNIRNMNIANHVICTWFDRYYCHPMISSVIKTETNLRLWYQPARVVIERRPLDKYCY